MNKKTIKLEVDQLAQRKIISLNKMTITLLNTEETTILKFHNRRKITVIR